MKITQVDAFTDEPFRGNPAAVCVLEAPADETWMQDVAREMNLSETAFLLPRDDGFDLRWFTPTIEVELCGHATLASAHVLWEEGHVKEGERIRFHTRWSGELTADRDGEWIVLDFPSRPTTEGPIDKAVIEAIGGAPVRTAHGVVGGGFSGYLLEYATEAEVRALGPAFGDFPDDGYITVTAPASRHLSDRGYDFVSRFFAPPAGIDEDPVTGSAHCTLGPWWADQLGKQELMAYQASARGGTLRVTVAGDRVLLGGKAVTVMRAELV